MGFKRSGTLDSEPLSKTQSSTTFAGGGSDARPGRGLECCADRLTELYEALVEDFGSTGGSDFGPWDQLRGRLEAEWKLIAEKATALSAAVVETHATKAMLV